MSLTGTWIIWNQWSGQQAYKFPATFKADGTITVSGGYFGTWTVLGTSSQVSLAIANFSQGSITSYNGNVLGPAMGGQMTGATQGGSAVQGIWSALQQDHATAAESELRAPGQ